MVHITSTSTCDVRATDFELNICFSRNSLVHRSFSAGHFSQCLIFGQWLRIDSDMKLMVISAIEGIHADSIKNNNNEEINFG